MVNEKGRGTWLVILQLDMDPLCDVGSGAKEASYVSQPNVYLVDEKL
jgi:hypothetical protein